MPPGPTTTYDPSQTILSLMGFHIDGFFDGSFLSVERDEDSFTLKVGADGEAARAKNANKAGKIVFQLMQSSPSNDILSGFVVEDEQSGTAIGPADVRETTQGTSVASCPDAYVLKPAKLERGKEIVGYEWTIICPHLNLFVGGALPVP